MDTNKLQDEFIASVDKHRSMIHKVCSMYASAEFDHKDLFQEIVIQLWRSYPSFRGDSKFSTWLYRIALNTAISGLRKKRPDLRSMEPSMLPQQMQDIPFDASQEDKLKQLHLAINQLSEVERAIVMLYLEDKSYDEMEEILGINQNNLRVKMNRIKDRLRKITKTLQYGT